MTKQEIIEKAAKALWNDVCDEHNQWESLDEMEQSVLRGQAAAALSTLRPGTILPGGLVVVPVIGLLEIRDALVIRDIDEAYHQLRVMADSYSIAGPDHFADWEQLSETGDGGKAITERERRDLCSKIGEVMSKCQEMIAALD